MAEREYYIEMLNSLIPLMRTKELKKLYYFVKRIIERTRGKDLDQD